MSLLKTQNFMKRILTGALALVLFAGAAQAQTKDTANFHHRQGRGMMTQQLNLTADQQAKLKSIHDAERKEMEALKTKSLTAEQSKEQRKALHKKYQEQMQSVFTPAQKEQLKKLKAERKQNGERKGNHKKGVNRFTKRGNEFQKNLNLTQTQKDQLSKLRNDARSQKESIRSNESLTREQKKEKMNSLRKDQQEKFKSVLTKEQVEKLESAKKERQAKNTK
jgi:Spy/CpxP family protein refolding chaperone